MKFSSEESSQFFSKNDQWQRKTMTSINGKIYGREELNDLKDDQYYTIRRGAEAVYYGQIINDKKHGKGILYYKNGRLYEGYWENNLKHGRGFEIFANASYYDGYYVNGKPEGVGTFEWTNGEIYEGQWLNGLKHGSGIWKGAKGDSYIGEWKFGKADGEGVHIWLNGDRYEGSFRNCMKQGYGQEKFGNGDTYVGNYENGKPHGQGEYFWSNGATYLGQFKNGLRHGKGVWQRGNGLSDKYEGYYENDKKHGNGIFEWADGNRYEGQFKGDVREGFGKMHWNDGSFYQGQWKNGIQDGEGILYLNDGKDTLHGIFLGNKLIQKKAQHTHLSSEQNQQQQFESIPVISELEDESIQPSNQHVDSIQPQNQMSEWNEKIYEEDSFSDKLRFQSHDESERTQNKFQYSTERKLVDNFTQTERGNQQFLLRNISKSFQHPMQKGIEKKSIPKLPAKIQSMSVQMTHSPYTNNQRLAAIKQINVPVYSNRQLITQRKTYGNTRFLMNIQEIKQQKKHTWIPSGKVKF